MKNVIIHISVVRHPSVMVGFPASDSKSLTVMLLENLVVPYQVTGSPTMTVSWFHEGEHLIDNSRISHNWTHLSLQEVMTHDAGLYTVTAENSVGSDSDQFSLIVQSNLVFYNLFRLCYYIGFVFIQMIQWQLAVILIGSSGESLEQLLWSVV